MAHISRTRRKSCLCCSILFATLFALTACSTPVNSAPESHSSPFPASLGQVGDAKCLQPPTHVDLQVSTDQQLVSWGLPTHQMMDNNPTLVKNFTNLAHRVCGSNPNVRPLPLQQLPMDNTVETGIWAGSIARGNRDTYTEANMSFTVPTLTGTPGLADTSAAEWIGVGDGYTSPVELVQTGVSSDVDPNNHQTNYAFWEVVGGGLSLSVQPMNLTVNPGDRMWVYVDSNTDSDGYDGFLVEDITQGTYQTAYEYNPDAFSDGSSAECIVERPSVNGGPRPLAQFGTISITGCSVYTNGQGGMAPIGDVSNDQINMVDNSVTLASTSPLSPLTNGSNFDITWQNTGNGVS